MLTTTTWTVEIQLFEADDDTSAKATLITGQGPARHRSITGSGRAHRKAGDIDIAEIGAEIAAARALRDLGGRLLDAASADIAAVQSSEVHLAH